MKSPCQEVMMSGLVTLAKAASIAQGSTKSGHPLLSGTMNSSRPISRGAMPILASEGAGDIMIVLRGAWLQPPITWLLESI